MAAPAPTLASLEKKISDLETQVSINQSENNTFYLLWAGALVFLMQAGFATLSAGSIRQKNVKNILLKNLLDACMGAMTFYFIGFGFAYDNDDGVDGHKANPFIGSGPSTFAFSGHNDNATNDYGNVWIGWYFQFAFAAAAATIVSGAVAERCQLGAYLIYTSFITGFIYPVVVHWVWDGSGWMSAFNSKDGISGQAVLPCIDFAGSGVVHMTGGWAAMVAAKILGERIGRWAEPQQFEGHSTPLVIIGTFLLWFGWYGFNPGSTLGIHAGSESVYGRDAARACVTTTLSAAAAGISGLFLKKWIPAKLGGSGVWDLGHTCNSLLGGLVSITAGCSVMTPACAVVTGIVGSIFYHMGSCAMRRAKIDDPLDAFAVHGACGFWGVVAVGIFATKEYSYSPPAGHKWRCNVAKWDEVTGTCTGPDLGPDAGIFMPGTRGVLFGIQLAVPIIEILWVVTLSFMMFFTMKKLGIFRVSMAEEVAGLDASKHGGGAYATNQEASKA